MKKILSASIFILTFCVFAFGQNANCPTISVTGPASVVLPGENMTFTANVSGVDLNKIEYKWSLEKGKIVEGQGTPVITISTEGLKDTTTTVTVEIKGLPAGCTNTASETSIMGCGGTYPILFDESELSSLLRNWTKLGNLISELEDNPNDTAYFIIYPHEKDSPDSIKITLNHIKNYLTANKINSDRLVFVMMDSGGYESDNSVIKIWRVPVGAQPPSP